MSEERIVFLTDIHIPHQIELSLVFEFVQDFKPTKIITGSDAHDWGAVSCFVADQSRHLEGGIVKENYKEIEKILLSPLKKAAPKAEIIWLTSNHDDWLRKAIQADPNLKGYIELENNLPKGIRIIPLNQAYHVNENLCYMHGLYTTKYHAFQTVHAVHKSVFYSHTHDVQRYTDISPVDSSQFYTGASCGCLCNLNPAYLKNKPNRWVHGLNYCYVDTKTKEFAEVQVYIIHNKFWALGRRYA